VTEHKRRRQKKRMRRKSVCVCVRERELDSELRSQTTIHLGATCKRWRDALAPYRRQLLLLYIAHTPIHTHRDIYVCVCEQASKLSHSTHTHSRLVCSGCVTFFPLGNRFFAKKKWPGGATSYQKLAPVLSLPFPSADILRSEKTQLVLGSFSAYCATHEMAIADLK
jgi:hypothetical protein